MNALRVRLWSHTGSGAVIKFLHKASSSLSRPIQTQSAALWFHISAHMKEWQHPGPIQYVSQHFCDNQTDKQTGRIQTCVCVCVFNLRSHPKHSHRMPGVVVEMRWGEWAAGLFPGISDCVGYVSLLLLGFSKDRFPLSSAEEFNQRIWKSHDVTVSLYFLCEKASGDGGKGQWC